MESIFIELALHRSNIEWARTDNVFFPYLRSVWVRFSFCAISKISKQHFFNDFFQDFKYFKESLGRLYNTESILGRQTNLGGVSWEYWCQTVKYQEFKGAQGGD